MLRVFSVILFLFSATALAQDTYTGTPFIRNFHKSVYNADTQNWGISQDDQGFMHFANNNGLLSFDGVEWDLTKISSISPLRSILVDSNNRICVGLINDFGIIIRKGDKQAGDLL